ncbi:MAG: Rieske 2Fe-2S domain-containing protein [Thermomicrobiales bacterium]
MSKQAKTLSGFLEGEQFAWLETVANPLQDSVTRVFNTSDGARQVKSLLNGTQARHRIHPMLVAAPLGAWIMAAAFDALEVFGRSHTPHFRTAADTAIGVGIVSSSAAVLTGLADFADLWGHPRRVTVAHALSNTTALACYSASLALRLAGQRSAGRMFAGAGFGALALGGALGGDLVYNLGTNVRVALYPKPQIEERDVLASDEIAEGERVVVEDGWSPVMLYRTAGQVYAVEDWCPHAGGPLSEGPIHDCIVTCPWHGSRFDVRNGAPLTGPASSPLRTFDVREDGGRILISPNYEGRDWPDPPKDPRTAPEHIAASEDD